MYLPTKYKGFCARLGPCGKIDLCKGYWNSPVHTENQTHLKRSLNYMANGNIKTIFGKSLITK